MSDGRHGSKTPEIQAGALFDQTVEQLHHGRALERAGHLRFTFPIAGQPPKAGLSRASGQSVIETSWRSGEHYRLNGCPISLDHYTFDSRFGEVDRYLVSFCYQKKGGEFLRVRLDVKAETQSNTRLTLTRC